MLGLCQDIGCNNAGVCCAVGDDPDLAGACREIDLGFFPQHHLCQRHVHVTGSHNLLHRADGLRTQRHGRNSLCSTGAVDLGDTGNIERNEGQGLDGRGGTGADLLHTGDKCRDSTHEGG